MVWPMAAITVSTCMVNSEFSIGFGFRLPELSGSPKAILMHSMEATVPFWAVNFSGAARK